jgi:hypothetical protein
MKELLDRLEKHWFVISAVFTVLSSVVTGGWWLYGKIDKLNDTVNDTQQWVQDHQDTINQHDHDLIILKEDERLREAGLLKR